MKAIIFVIILQLSFTEIFSQQSGWTWINRLPQGNTLFSSAIVSPGTVLITGDWGALLKSTNYGSAWSNMFTMPFSNYCSLFFVNNNTGYAGGNFGNPNIYKTTNAGNNWQLLTTGLTQYEYINNIFFYDQNTGIATVNYGKLLKTTNGGNTWSIIPPALSENIYDFIGFNNSNASFARTNSRMLKSFSMGDNWMILPIPDSTRNIYDMFFLNPDTGMYLGAFGYYEGSAKFVKTTDGGYSWFSYNTISNYQWRSMFFLNERTGFITGSSYIQQETIAKTTDGGASWVVQEDSIKYTLNDIRFFNQNTGFASGSYGTLLTTTNGGLSWITLSRGFIDNITNMYFLNELTGYISTSYNKRILKTTDGCNSWDTMITAPENIHAVEFVNYNTGYIGGGDNFYAGFIYKTTNSGLNWTSQTYFQYRPVRNIRFLNALSGYATMEGGKIFKTTNGGNNWDSVSTVPSYTLYSMFFVNTNTGFLSGGSGRIYKSTNGGLNWAYTTIGGSGNMQDICFVNSVTGFATGSNAPYLYETTDLGVSWNPVNISFFTPNMYRIFFTDVNTGYVLSRERLIKTTNCGLTWWYQETVTNELSCIYFISASTGFIGGQYGKLLKTTNGGGNFVGINLQLTETKPEHFSLSQNYPNPFNPVTKIRFSIPLDSRLSGNENVALKIYDVLGREVATLVNEQLKPGTYEVSWNAANYPSGVYFYELLSKTFEESKKMILLR